MNTKKVEIEVMVNALAMSKSHISLTNSSSNVSIEMSMHTSLKIVPSQTEKRGSIFL